jgi:SAM-dependent methyltransferase/tetratricopeptide (TPR) repeat protein
MSRRERRVARKFGASGITPVAAERAEHLFNAALRHHHAGELAAAERVYRSLLAIVPKHAQSLYLLGILALQRGQPKEAIAWISKALALNEPIAEWHYNLAFAHQSLGRLDDAIAHYRRALALEPGVLMAWANLARALLASGETELALGAAARALEIEPSPETKQLVAECLSDLREVAATRQLRQLVLGAATDAWGDVASFGHVAAALLDPAIATMIRRAAEAWPQRLDADALLGPNGIGALAADRLFGCLLTTPTICRPELERFLTSLRSLLLAWAEDGGPLDADEAAAATEIGSLLARQCFLNGYLYASTDDETRRVERLKARLAAALEQGAPVPVLGLTAIAAYGPLHDFPDAPRLLRQLWPGAVRLVLQQQVEEPLAEAGAAIPAITAITDGVSLGVRRQYEESPYPRWVKVPAPVVQSSMDAYLRARFPSAPLRDLGKDGNLDILVAGCGTGQHPILVARQFPAAKVLALDLSRASLAYAQRKTSELGLDRIEYVQAAILNLGLPGRSFDVIEAVGVLHHLADPRAGWRVLLSLLRPGGVMNVGLYSEFGRRDVVRARAFIAERGYGGSPDHIRRCRQDILALDDASEVKQVATRFDFFSTSGCRDLLFHVQEHRLTLPVIKSFLAENDLQFLGFQLGAREKRSYGARFPEDPAMIDLDRWRAFEIDNPKTFHAMYRFWVQSRVPQQPHPVPAPGR